MDLFECDKKKLDHRYARRVKQATRKRQLSRRRNQKRGVGTDREVELFFCQLCFGSCESPSYHELIDIDSSRAPISKNNMIVWKWSKTDDSYTYGQASPDLTIAQKLPEGILQPFFEDIKNVFFYSHKQLQKYIDDKLCCWCTIFFIPTFCQSYIFASIYWTSKFHEQMAARKAAIEAKMRQFEQNVLQEISPTLKFVLSTCHGFITLIDYGIADPEQSLLMWYEQGQFDATSVPPEIYAKIEEKYYSVQNNMMSEANSVQQNQQMAKVQPINNNGQIVMGKPINNNQMVVGQPFNQNDIVPCNEIN